eukprot:4074428-Pyramimonas_sp.AAC.1
MGLYSGSELVAGSSQPIWVLASFLQPPNVRSNAAERPNCPPMDSDAMRPTHSRGRLTCGAFQRACQLSAHMCVSNSVPALR